jgi:tetratricopeptide (TPR) repeat protein
MSIVEATALIVNKAFQPAYDMLVSINPSSHRTHYLAALCCRKLGDYYTTQRHCKEALELAPDDFNTRILCVSVYRQLEKESNFWAVPCLVLHLEWLVSHAYNPAFTAELKTVQDHATKLGARCFLIERKLSGYGLPNRGISIETSAMRRKLTTLCDRNTPEYTQQKELELDKSTGLTRTETINLLHQQAKFYRPDSKQWYHIRLAELQHMPDGTEARAELNDILTKHSAELAGISTAFGDCLFDVMVLQLLNREICCSTATWVELCKLINKCEDVMLVDVHDFLAGLQIVHRQRDAAQIALLEEAMSTTKYQILRVRCQFELELRTIDEDDGVSSRFAPFINAFPKQSRVSTEADLQFIRHLIQSDSREKINIAERRLEKLFKVFTQESDDETWAHLCWLAGLIAQKRQSHQSAVKYFEAATSVITQEENAALFIKILVSIAACCKFADPDKALRTMKVVIELQPGIVCRLLDFADLSASVDPDAAEFVCQAVASRTHEELDPQWARSYLIRGNCYINRDPVVALSHYTLAISSKACDQNTRFRIIPYIMRSVAAQNLPAAVHRLFEMLTDLEDAPALKYKVLLTACYAGSLFRCGLFDDAVCIFNKAVLLVESSTSLVEFDDCTMCIGDALLYMLCECGISVWHLIKGAHGKEDMYKRARLQIGKLLDGTSEFSNDTVATDPTVQKMRSQLDTIGYFV